MTDERLAVWLAGRLGTGPVQLEGHDRSSVGHSAETLLMTIVEQDGRRHDVVVRLRPPEPGLLEPYDLHRQFTVLRALEPTAVRSPKALWHEPTGDVLGREFYVMERLDGTVYEQVTPEAIGADAAAVDRMCESFVQQLAAIHSVDLDATGLAALGDGTGYVQAELDHWEAELHRMARGRLPALERLARELRATQPAGRSVPTLVHGDAKPGNYGYVGHEVSAVYDWELATIGEPLTDLGWAEVLWTMPGSFTTLPGAWTIDRLATRWSELTGIETHDRAWFRAMQAFKMTAIMQVGAMLFDTGRTDDLRLAMMGYGVPMLTDLAYSHLGLTRTDEHGAVGPRDERFAEVRARTTRTR